MKKTIARRLNRLELLLPPEPPAKTTIQVLFVGRDQTVIKGPTFNTSSRAGAATDSGVAAALGKHRDDQ